MSKKSFAKKVAASLAACSLILGAVAITGCSAPSKGSSSSKASSAKSSAASSSKKQTAANVKTTGDLTGKHKAELTVKGYEPIIIELDADSAPISASNFADLVKKGYYDGKTFYRIQDGFVIQGGTLGNNAAGNDPSLDPVAGEFSSNGYENPLADNYGKGYLAMARTNDPDSATSTFFITLDNSDMVGQSLNGNYAAFGTIDDAGMKTIEKIVADYIGKVAPNDQMGIIASEADQPVIEKITLLD